MRRAPRPAGRGACFPACARIVLAAATQTHVCRARPQLTKIIHACMRNGLYTHMCTRVPAHTSNRAYYDVAPATTCNNASCGMRACAQLYAVRAHPCNSRQLCTCASVHLHMCTLAQVKLRNTIQCTTSHLHQCTLATLHNYTCAHVCSSRLATWPNSTIGHVHACATVQIRRCRTTR